MRFALLEATPALLIFVTRYLPRGQQWRKLIEVISIQEFITMGSLTDAQVLSALVLALIPGILALRLSTELYK
jgi:photosystem I subunit 12